MPWPGSTSSALWAWPMWPDGTIATRYAFRHALYHQAAYERLGIGRRAQLHQRIGLRLEEAYGLQTGELAASLGGPFRGRAGPASCRALRAAGGRAGVPAPCLS